MHRVAAAALLALLVISHPTEARADARELSRESFLRGVGQAHKGDYAEARDSFLEAYKLFAHPSILLNLGIARWHTGEYVAAEQDLVRFMSDDGGSSPDEIASARAALAATRGHLGTLRVRILPDGARARLDTQAIPLVPGAFAEVRAVAGLHQLRAEAEGYEALDQSIDVPAARSTDVQITLALAGEGRSPGKPTPGSEPPGRHVVLGWSLAGAGVALAAIGAVCGLEAISDANAYNSRDGGSSFQNPGVRSTGIAFRTTADVLFLAAIASGGIGAYFLISAPSAVPKPGAGPSVVGTRLLLGPSFSGLVGSF
jgi:hypothetical protein